MSLRESIYNNEADKQALKSFENIAPSIAKMGAMKSKVRIKGEPKKRRSGQGQVLMEWKGADGVSFVRVILSRNVPSYTITLVVGDYADGGPSFGIRDQRSVVVAGPKEVAGVKYTSLKKDKGYKLKRHTESELRQRGYMEEAAGYSNTEDFIPALKKAISKHLPKGHVFVQAQTGIGDPLIYVRTGLKDERGHVSVNDRAFQSFHIYGLNGDGTVKDKMDASIVTGGSLLVKPERPSHMAYESIKFGWRKKKGTPAQIVKHFDNYFSKVAKVVKANKARLAESVLDEAKSLLKWKEKEYHPGYVRYTAESPKGKVSLTHDPRLRSWRAQVTVKGNDGTTIGMNKQISGSDIEDAKKWGEAVLKKDIKKYGRKGLKEGYEDYKKDPNFFDQSRPGGKYIATLEGQTPRSGMSYVAIKKRDADRIMKHRGSKPHPQGWLSIWFVPAEYAKTNKIAISHLGNFKPIWDWGRGKMKGGFS